jgi:hypothetical protein
VEHHGADQQARPKPDLAKGELQDENTDAARRVHGAHLHPSGAESNDGPEELVELPIGPAEAAVCDFAEKAKLCLATSALERFDQTMG